MTFFDSCSGAKSSRERIMDQAAKASKHACRQDSCLTCHPLANSSAGNRPDFRPPSEYVRLAVNTSVSTIQLTTVRQASNNLCLASSPVSRTSGRRRQGRGHRKQNLEAVTVRSRRFQNHTAATWPVRATISHVDITATAGKSGCHRVLWHRAADCVHLLAIIEGVIRKR